MTWQARFAAPIPVAGRKPLKTLSDARAYILALPSDEQELAHWQAAGETLLAAGEHGGAWVNLAHRDSAGAQRRSEKAGTAG